MRRTSPLLLALLIAVPTARAAGEPPYDTEPASLAQSGEVRVDAGAALATGAARPLFPEESGEGAALRAGLRTGLGAWGEMRLAGDLHVWFRPDGGPRVGDLGDWRFSTKVRFGPAGRRVGWAGRLEVKLPVASDADGLGTDLADVGLGVLAGGAVGRHRWDVNAGLAILGAPFRERSQVDVLTYAGLYRLGLGERWELGVELAGREGGDFFPARSALRFGARARMGAWWFNGALAVGLARGSPDAELRLGVQYRFQRGQPTG